MLLRCSCVKRAYVLDALASTHEQDGSERERREEEVRAEERADGQLCVFFLRSEHHGEDVAGAVREREQRGAGHGLGDPEVLGELRDRGCEELFGDEGHDSELYEHHEDLAQRIERWRGP